MKICFVCLGNIVRSPLAEGLFRHLAEERGVGDQYQVDSAGTSSFHVGEEPDPRMRKVARRKGLEYTGRSRQFQPEDFERFDLIIAMDADNRRQLHAMASTPEQREKVRLLREYDPQGGGDQGVPDPYYGGMQGFEKVWDIVRRSTENLLDKLEADADS
jgi:protein-tyrosine phosphatase